MSYQRPEDRVVTERDRDVVVTQSGGNTGIAVVTGILIVLAVIFFVWLLGNNGSSTATTGSPVETTGSGVETTVPTETTLPAITTTAP